jgi:hypothetical protein
MRRALVLVLLATVIAGCGFDVQAPDLFLVTRTGEGSKLTLLVNDSGSIRCNGRTRSLPDPLLLQARSLATALAGDAADKLRIKPGPRSVYQYTVRVQQGTIRFADNATAAGKFPALAQLEQFTLQAAQQACGVGS